MRNDRLSLLEQDGLSDTDAIAGEFAHGLASLASGEAARGATRFVVGEGRHGSFEKPTSV